MHESYGSDDPIDARKDGEESGGTRRRYRREQSSIVLLSGVEPPTDYESVSYQRRVLLIQHLRRLPISKPMSPRHNYDTVNVDASRMRVGNASRKRGFGHRFKHAVVDLDWRARRQVKSTEPAQPLKQLLP